MSDLREWENLEFNCLVNILGRVGVESLLLDVPFVCKPWYKASLNPSRWQHLRIPAVVKTSRGRIPSYFKRFLDRFVKEYHIKIITYGRFMSFLISRGFTKSTFLDLSASRRCSYCPYSDEYMQHVVKKCPEVKSLLFGLLSNKNVPKFVGKWKQLEEVTLEATMRDRMFDEILAEIAVNCKDLKSLIVRSGTFRVNHAKSIAKHIPKIKKLRIKICYVEHEDMEILLRRCKELEYFDVSSCGYVDKWDEKKLKQLGSHIKKLNLAVYKAYGTAWDSDFSESDCEYYDYNADSSNYNDSVSAFEKIFLRMR